MAKFGTALARGRVLMACATPLPGEWAFLSLNLNLAILTGVISAFASCFLITSFQMAKFGTVLALGRVLMGCATLSPGVQAFPSQCQNADRDHKNPLPRSQTVAVAY